RDWSSDVCSSDLPRKHNSQQHYQLTRNGLLPLKTVTPSTGISSCCATSAKNSVVPTQQSLLNILTPLTTLSRLLRWVVSKLLSGLFPRPPSKAYLPSPIRRYPIALNFWSPGLPAPRVQKPFTVICSLLLNCSTTSSLPWSPLPKSSAEASSKYLKDAP